MRLNIFYIIIFVFLSVSCTDTNEETFKFFNVSVQNQSDQIITLQGYNQQDDLVFTKEIGAMLNENICTPYSVNFTGIVCQADSLVFKFPNNKGYLCALRTNGTAFCFPDKSPFNSTDFLNLGNNNYQFTITQDDFDNAFDLP